MLLRPEVMVFEPLWTVIPSNKAILPVLWSLFPHHRYLLDADFELNAELEQSGYAVKPIAGRCGNNIGLISHEDQVLDETSGKFSEQKISTSSCGVCLKWRALYSAVCVYCWRSLRRCMRAFRDGLSD